MQDDLFQIRLRDGHVLDLGLGQRADQGVDIPAVQEADRAAQDYRREEAVLPADGKINCKMAPGGGWVAVIR